MAKTYAPKLPLFDFLRANLKASILSWYLYRLETYKEWEDKRLILRKEDTIYMVEVVVEISDDMMQEVEVLVPLKMYKTDMFDMNIHLYDMVLYPEAFGQDSVDPFLLNRESFYRVEEPVEEIVKDCQYFMYLPSMWSKNPTEKSVGFSLFGERRELSTIVIVPYYLVS